MPTAGAEARVSAVLKPVEVPLRLPVKLLPILEPKRFKVMHGGRGGGKSHTVAQVLLMMAMQRKLRILCVREVQKSLKESSMQVLKDYIERLGLAAHFEVLKTEIRCLTTGSTFGFSGLKDHTADSIKSWEGADIVWVEEAHSVTARSWTILIPTIRKAGSEIWATFNPDQVTDYVYDRFVKNTDPDAWVCRNQLARQSVVRAGNGRRAVASSRRSTTTSTTTSGRASRAAPPACCSSAAGSTASTWATSPSG
jgi:PBSX family phage terminase large subunit